MKKITAIVVDDEISAALSLKGMLQEYCPEIQVLAHASNVEEAFLYAQKYNPKLVFLDIEMPPLGNGFDFLQKFRHKNFGVIFTTAYAEYAIKAINEAQPWAYLVKPFSDLDLIQAVKTAVMQLEEKHTEGNNPEERRIIISDQRKGNIVVRIADIISCEADGATTDIYYLNDGKVERITASRTLKDIEKELPESMFIRTHHSYLVNFYKILRFEKKGRNGCTHLVGNRSVDISVLKMDYFQERFRAFIHKQST